MKNTANQSTINLDLIPPYKRKPHGKYIKIEDTVLKKVYPVDGAEACQQLLYWRTLESIRQRANRLKLRSGILARRYAKKTRRLYSEPKNPEDPDYGFISYSQATKT